MMNYEQLQRLVDKSQLKEGMVISEVADGNAYKYTILHIEWLNAIDSAIIMAHQEGRCGKVNLDIRELTRRIFFIGYNRVFLLDRQIEQLHAKIATLREERMRAL